MAASPVQVNSHYRLWTGSRSEATVRAVSGSTVTLAIAFGQVVRERRLAAGLTQEQLADKAKVHRTYVGYLENGKQSPTLDVVESLAVAFGTPAHELIAAAERWAGAQAAASRPENDR